MIKRMGASAGVILVAVALCSASAWATDWAKEFLSESAGQKQTINSMLESLTAAKFAGSCGMLNALLVFQDATKMPGGDEFLARFLATENARLNITTAERADLCEKSIYRYNREVAFWEAELAAR